MPLLELQPVVTAALDALPGAYHDPTAVWRGPLHLPRASEPKGGRCRANPYGEQPRGMRRPGAYAAPSWDRPGKERPGARIRSAWQVSCADLAGARAAPRVRLEPAQEVLTEASAGLRETKAQVAASCPRVRADPGS